jgi:phosphatidate cytidylyltransferase
MDFNRLKESVFGNKERVVTGIAMIIALVVILSINNIYLIWLVLGIAYIVGLIEVSKLFGIKSNTNVVFLGIITWLSLLVVDNVMLISFIPAMVYASLQAYKNDDMKEVLPFIYPTIGMILFFGLYKEFGLFSVIWLIITVAFTDTFAYFSGKYLGKTKFSPTSPNKTLEGVAGGIIAGSIFGSVAGLYFKGFLIALVLSFLVSFFSVFGDLFESYLKRKAGVKDSGNLFPGHGGILDRLDGYMFGVIILYVGMKLV